MTRSIIGNVSKQVRRILNDTTIQKVTAEQNGVIPWYAGNGMVMDHSRVKADGHLP